MSPKQEIYQHMLRLTLPYIRNRTGGNWYHRIRDTATYHEAELIHNLPNSIFEPEIEDHDIWFLNVQARQYHDQCNPQISSLYHHQLRMIRELFDLVPPSLRSELQWNGPDIH